MKKKLLFASLTPVLLSMIIGCSNGASSNKNLNNQNYLNNQIVEDDAAMTNKEKTRKEYQGYINDLSTFPSSFMYGPYGYQGFRSDLFKVVSSVVETTGPKERHIITMKMNDGLTVILDTSFYYDYNAFDWTIYFKNEGEKDSLVLRELNAADYNLKGSNPKIKGILGDHENQYAAYEKDISMNEFIDENTIGRSTHVTFPYYNLENDEGGAMLAIGWPGTYRAKFYYNQSTQTTNFVGQGCLDFASLIKPGETVMTPLMAVVRYYERDEDFATNAWRKWYVDCNAPDVDGKGTKFSPIQGVILKRDCQADPNSNDAVSETYQTWKRSFDAVIDSGMDYDFRLIDAGWYSKPNGGATTDDWWSYVGTWEICKTKWPGETFKETIDYGLDRGKFTQLWFESERVTQIDDICTYEGFKREWAIADHGDNNLHFVNLSLEDAYQWLRERILNIILTYKIGLYREDFNAEPANSWRIYDNFNGPNRTGITENRYIQNHFRLWDEVIAAQLSVGGCNYVDTCASGGGRLDLLTLRYSYPFNRSDADWAMCYPHSMPLRLAFSHSTFKWLPLGGVYVNEMADGQCGMYNLRASYTPIMTYALQFSYNKNLDWDNIHRAQAEWSRLNNYLYKDYYPLTPYHKVTDDKTWDVFQFMDPETGEGVIQGFRKEKCLDRTCKVQIKGIDPNKYYELEDTDGYNSLAKVKGRALMNGLDLILDNPASACVIFIKEVK